MIALIIIPLADLYPPQTLYPDSLNLREIELQGRVELSDMLMEQRYEGALYPSALEEYISLMDYNDFGLRSIQTLASPSFK